MAYVITQNCCNDASCIAECPVDCIRPTPEERAAFASTEMLYIDPDSCIDCGACVEACPVGAVSHEDELPGHLSRFVEFNAGYFLRHPLEASGAGARPPRPDAGRGELSVAVVGAGPSGAYIAEELLERGNARVTVYDALPTPWGLLRSGVAPDHQHTKGLAGLFEKVAGKPQFDLVLNARIGADLSVDDLRSAHHAVVVATGAADGQEWKVSGADLKGVHAAADFVAWYNGHPDHADRSFDLSHERVVIVGNGNVALDMARVLTLPPEELAKTDLADHAFAALRKSNVREVVVVGRRGPLQAAYTSPEFHALAHLPGVAVVIDPAEAQLDAVSQAVLDSGRATYAEGLKAALAAEFSTQPASPGSRRIVFRYLAEPTAVLGTDSATGIELARTLLVDDDGRVRAERTDDLELLEAGLVLTSVGYRGRPIPGVPFDDASGTVPNNKGRVVDHEGIVVAGTYATGWIRRGAQGGLGSSRIDAHDVVSRIVEDFNGGVLDDPVSSVEEVAGRAGASWVGLEGWRAIDSAERAAGRSTGRPRVKLVTVDELLAASAAVGA